jgi:hypothetical protein
MAEHALQIRDTVFESLGEAVAPILPGNAEEPAGISRSFWLLDTGARRI